MYYIYVAILRWTLFPSIHSLCLFDRDNSHEKLIDSDSRRGRVGVGCAPPYLLSVFSGSLGGLSAPLAELCLLGMACNQLLSLSLPRRLGWAEERALSLFQHVREKTLPRTPRENTDTNTASLSHHVRFMRGPVGLSEGLCWRKNTVEVLIVKQCEKQTHYWIFHMF